MALDPLGDRLCHQGKGEIRVLSDATAPTGLILGLIFLQHCETKPTSDIADSLETRGIIDEINTLQPSRTSFQSQGAGIETRKA